MQRWQEDYAKDSKQWQASLIDAIHRGHGALSENYSATERPVAEREDRLRRSILKSLYYLELRDRHNRISDAYEKTFQWIYGDPYPGEKSWTHFVQWLESDENLYWITGKAGSGKSTLMKYLFNDTRTLEHLNIWASGRPLLVAAFFFWDSGTDLQKSHDGLFRSLLFQLLTESPELIPHLLPERWDVFQLFGEDETPWNSSELRRAFERLAGTDMLDAKYCLIIDGLDEFDGDNSNLINFLKDISSTRVKVCVSSRPWNVFRDALSHQPNLMLQHLTYPDIKFYIDSAFINHTGFAELQQREPQYAGQLLEAIARKASGVFLWVHLVVRSLLAGLLNSDRVSDLQRRLDYLPPDLESLYEKMLKSLEPFYFEHAAQYFQIVHCAEEPPTLLRMSFADETPNFVQKFDAKSLDDDARQLRANCMTKRLNSRCKGLLEVGSNDHNYEDSAFSAVSKHPPTSSHGTLVLAPSSKADLTVQYLHRTVKEYLRSPKVWNQILSATDGEFCPSLNLCMSIVMELKSMSPDSLSWTHFKFLVDRCLRYAYQTQEDPRASKRFYYLTLLLDELDLTSTKLLNTPIEGEKPLIQRWTDPSARNFQNHWVHLLWNHARVHPVFFARLANAKFDIPRNFLSLVVKADLRSYLDVKVQEADKSLGSLDSLLVYAVVLDWDLFEAFSRCRIPSHQMVKWLFEHGANPNLKLPSGTTLWKALITHVIDMIRFTDTTTRRSEDIERVLQTMAIFLENGADPKVSLYLLQVTYDMPEVQKLIDMAQQKAYQARPRYKRMLINRRRQRGPLIRPSDFSPDDGQVLGPT